MQSTKKAPYRREEGATPANEDEASTARPDSPHQSQQPVRERRKWRNDVNGLKGWMERLMKGVEEMVRWRVESWK